MGGSTADAQGETVDANVDGRIKGKIASFLSFTIYNLHNECMTFIIHNLNITC